MTNIRTGVSAEEIKQAFLDNMRCVFGRSERVATKQNVYYALALTMRDRLFAHAEYLPGPQLANAHFICAGGAIAADIPSRTFILGKKAVPGYFITWKIQPAQ